MTKAIASQRPCTHCGTGLMFRPEVGTWTGNDPCTEPEHEPALSLSERIWCVSLGQMLAADQITPREANDLLYTLSTTGRVTPDQQAMLIRRRELAVR